MRWIFFLFAVGNVLYFAWEGYLKPTPLVAVPAQTDAPVTRNLPPVVLLSEANSLEDEGIRGEDQILQRGHLALGGFMEAVKIEDLRQRLLAIGVNGKILKRELKAEQEFWVFLPPLSSRAATLRLLKELQARKFDGFLIAQGELANGISLGIFSQENSANMVLERLRVAGYQAQVRKIMRNQAAYWLEVPPEGQRLLDEKILATLRKDFPGMQYVR